MFLLLTKYIYGVGEAGAIKNKILVKKGKFYE